jgi:hypothetical protein
MGQYGDHLKATRTSKLQEATAAWVILVQNRLSEGDWVHVWDNYEFSWDADTYKGVKMRDIYHELAEDDAFETKFEEEGTDFVRGYYVRWKDA